MYFSIKFAHIIFAVISGSFFLLRGCWMLMDSPRLQKTWVKVLPHINDTALLGCAIALAVMSQQYPLQQDWLSVKVLGLLIYIGLGMVALRGKTLEIRALAFIAALIVFAFIFSVARAHHPLGFIIFL